MDNVRDSFRRQGLVRPRQGRVLGGVCAGLGRRFDITPGIARLLFVLVLFVVPGSQILIYPLLWFLMPEEGAPSPSTPTAPYPPAG
jgi:phage shock protein PspC (stress-responsive transcriptional regulator)